MGYTHILRDGPRSGNRSFIWGWGCSLKKALPIFWRFGWGASCLLPCVLSLGRVARCFVALGRVARCFVASHRTASHCVLVLCVCPTFAPNLCDFITSSRPRGGAFTPRPYFIPLNSQKTCLCNTLKINTLQIILKKNKKKFKKVLLFLFYSLHLLYQ